MNSIERVRAAIARKPVDSIPLGFYAADCDTVSRVIGHRTFVRDKIGTQVAFWEGRRDEVVESLKKDTVEFYRKISSADILLPKEGQMMVPPKGYQPPPVKKIADDKWQDEQGRIFQAVWHANELACVHDPRPPRTDYTVAEFETPLDLTPPDPSIFEVFDYVYDQLGAERYIASQPAVTGMTLLGGTENGLYIYAAQPEVVMAANRRSVATQNFLDPYRIRKNAPGAFVDHDTAGTNGPLVSPRMFREMCLPFFAERIRHIKQFAPQVILHNCGNNLPIMDMILDAGVDCYQSLQTNAGMDIARLKRDFGHKACFWGGVPVEQLIMGTPDDIRESVRAAMEAGGGTGFILGPSHSVAYGVKYENFMAMIDEHDKLKSKYC